MRGHFLRIFKNRVSLAVILLVILIPCLEIIQHLIPEIQHSGDPGYSMIHPARAFFLSGSSEGHVYQIMLLWFLPLYLMLISAEYPIQDYETGMLSIYVSKLGKKGYYKSIMNKTFTSSFLVMYIALMINLLMVTVLFNGGMYWGGINEFSDSSRLLTYSLEHPYVTVYYYILVTSFVAGLLGMACASFCVFFKDRKYAYSASFMLWLWLTSGKTTLLSVFQPFISGNSLENLLPVFAVSCLVMIAVCISIYVYEVRYSEE